MWSLNKKASISRGFLLLKNGTPKGIRYKSFKEALILTVYEQNQ